MTDENQTQAIGFAWPEALSLFTPVKNSKSENNKQFDYFQNGKSPNIHSLKIHSRQNLRGPCKKSHDSHH